MPAKEQILHVVQCVDEKGIRSFAKLLHYLEAVLKIASH